MREARANRYIRTRRTASEKLRRDYMLFRYIFGAIVVPRIRQLRRYPSTNVRDTTFGRNGRLSKLYGETTVIEPRHTCAKVKPLIQKLNQYQKFLITYIYRREVRKFDSS